MRTYILKWNPAISSTTCDDIQEIIWCSNNNIYFNYNWSIYDWQQAERGDRFYMLRVGKGKVGIIGSGWFTSNPWEGDDWAGTDNKRHYVNILFDTIIRPQRSKILETKQIQAAIPTVDWKGGHSGVLIQESEADTLLNLWQNLIKDNPKQFDRGIAYSSHQNQAYGIALNAHRHQVDKAGKDYIEAHILDVYDRADFDDDDVITDAIYTVSLLHDTVEDSDWTIDRLRQFGFTEEMLEALQCVTKQKGEDYDYFIDRIMPNHIARLVKIADLCSNMDITRLNEITDEDVARLRKYHKAYKKLSAYEEQQND